MIQRTIRRDWVFDTRPAAVNILHSCHWWRNCRKIGRRLAAATDGRDEAQAAS